MVTLNPCLQTLDVEVHGSHERSPSFGLWGRKPGRPFIPLGGRPLGPPHRAAGSWLERVAGRDGAGVTSALLVDDAGVGLHLRVTLSHRGFDTVGEADDGSEGVERASRSQPDVIVLEPSMPMMDELTTFRSSPRSQRAHPFSTAQDDDIQAASTTAFGVRAFLRKPTMTHLAQVLTGVLGDRSVEKSRRSRIGKAAWSRNGSGRRRAWRSTRQSE